MCAGNMVCDVQPSEAVASTVLLALAANIATMKRLLSRRDDDGALVLAEAALIKLTIMIARDETARVTMISADLPDDPSAPYRGGVVTLLDAVADLDIVLEVLMDAVSKLDG